MASAANESTAPDPLEIGPADVPAERPEALGLLEGLLGEWEMEFSFEAGSFAGHSGGARHGRTPRRAVG
jgi:hypothetical protein